MDSFREDEYRGPRFSGVGTSNRRSVNLRRKPHDAVARARKSPTEFERPRRLADSSSRRSSSGPSNANSKTSGRNSCSRSTSTGNSNARTLSNASVGRRLNARSGSAKSLRRTSTGARTRDARGRLGRGAAHLAEIDRGEATSLTRALQREPNLFVTHAVLERGIRLLDEQ